MPIDHFNLRSFDLNLLLAFDALMQTKSVTGAAHALRIQQPSMSHALSTLRLLLDDPLLKRVGSKMEPTLRAQAIAVKVREILEQTQDVLARGDAFSPEREHRIVRIGVNGQIEAFLLPALAARLAKLSPHIRLLIRAASRQAIFELLDDGGVDIAIGYFPGGGSQHVRKTIYQESLACCWHPSQISLRAPISVSNYLAVKHALVSAKNNMVGYLEDFLDSAKLNPDVAMSSPNFITLLSTAAIMPLMVTLTARVASSYASLFGLVVSEVPGVASKIPVELLWHTRADRDPATIWLCQQIQEIAAELDQPA